MYTEGGALPFGVIDIVTTKTFEYLGSEPAPVIVMVQAEGYVENINITMGGITCHIECELSEGDVLTADAGAKIVKINGAMIPANKYDANALQKMWVEYGNNTVTVESDDEGNVAFSASIKYTGRYGGL